MTSVEIVQQLDGEIARLTRVRDLLAVEPVLEKRLEKRKYTMSAQARANISAGRKRLFAERRKKAA